MSPAIAMACVVPLLLVLWRSRREPRWLVYVRYAVAVLFVWQVVMMLVSHDTIVRVREARLRGDVQRAMYDTGPNAAAFMLGWIPGFLYVVVIGGARRLWLKVKAKKDSRP